ncbi:MAG: DUF3310 domain-containing protein [Patescibacteria group bacterium]|nr:DUF3310 domain-containing protein [Patescibacteria group bacterium]
MSKIADKRKSRLIVEAPVDVDNVNHPNHYTNHPSGVECIDIVEHFDFNIGNLIKYAWRAGLKSETSRLEDLRKCAWYAARAVRQEEKRMEKFDAIHQH